MDTRYIATEGPEMTEPPLHPALHIHWLALDGLPKFAFCAYADCPEWHQTAANAEAVALDMALPKEAVLHAAQANWQDVLERPWSVETD